MKTSKNTLFVLMISAFVLIQLASPTSAYADDGTEPPPTEAATADAPETEPVEVVPAEGESVSETEAVPVEEKVEGGEVVSETETAPVEGEAESDETALAEVLQAIPENTEVVVLDENSQPVPLATQEAAEIIAISDPMWCPAGLTTITAACKNDTTVAGLIAKLAATLKNADGVIYFMSAYGTPDATFNGAMDPNLILLSDNSLTLQGGWNGDVTLGNAIVHSGQSVFSVPIRITNWTGDITLNNITVNGATSDGLTMSTVQDVFINDGVFSGNDGTGAWIYDAHDVTITDSTFSNNTLHGAEINGAQDVTITNSTVSNNDFDGMRIYNANNVTIAGSTFSGNGDYGAHQESVNHVSITNSVFNGNNVGESVYNVNNASISGGTLNENSFGFLAYSNTGVSNIAINTSSFNGNTDYGILAIANSGATINLTLDCGNVRYQNNGTNIYTEGNVIVNSCGGDIPEKPAGAVSQAVIYAPTDQSFVEFNMDCSLYDSYLVQWVGGDNVVLACVENGRARVSRLDNTALPSDLPDGFEYAAALAVEVFQNEAPLDILPVLGAVQLGFVSRHEDPNYGVVYWDAVNGVWIQLKDFQRSTGGGSVSFPLHPSDREDVYRVLGGARLMIDGSRYREVVTTNFPGIFVLAQR